MLPRRATTRLLPHLAKAVESQAATPGAQWRKCSMGAFKFSSGLIGVLPRVTTTSDLWLQQRTLLQSHHQHYHHPFTIARMYSNAFFQATQHPSSASVSLMMCPNPPYKKDCYIRLYSSKPPTVPSSSLDENQNETISSKGGKETPKQSKGEALESSKAEEKLSIVQKFKLMYKQYWYVLIPVHIATSIVWYGSFFIAAKSGVDIIPLMEKLGAGEKIISHLQSSNAGYYAIAYAMYKIATPARYTVTVGGTTLSINYLKKRGYIKPVPSSEKLKEMYEAVVVKVRAWTKMAFKEKNEIALPIRLYRPV
ncbi:protein FAM210A-like isoform X2 [Portunus trituberculatus]|uniref:protein FAM210A-like isoform X2 n=1 Tax=Portunus trituberculatus TaxID=210409 RepID=UPI001E1CC8D8|nr:protein FAM210A-like isoform X2 [Portunus trituberculatus]